TSTLSWQEVKERVEVEKPLLTYKMLTDELQNISTFQSYIVAIKEAKQKMYARLEEVSQSQRAFLDKFHATYPQLEDVWNHADQASLKKYKHITGIDLEDGIPGQMERYDDFLSTLDAKYTFDMLDLSTLILEKTKVQFYSKSNCNKFCEDAAAEKQQEVTAECLKDTGEPCPRQASIARRYFHMGCMRGCRMQ
ncbi:MAG: hypothetical protein AAF696_15045, partial [Bacteroidota bacterium]